MATSSAVVEATVSPPKAATRPKRGSSAPKNVQADLSAAIAQDLQTKLALIRALGGESPDVTSEMCQAALTQADGRVAEALQILRTAQARLHQQTQELFDARVGLLEQREQEFRRDGLSVSLRPQITDLRTQFEDGNRVGALSLLASIDDKVGQFESNWKGLKGLLHEIDTLRGEAATLDTPLVEIDRELQRVKETLHQPGLNSDGLDAASQQAAHTLMLLHEAIPTTLEKELATHEATLDLYPDEHEPSTRARRLHAEAGRHLKKGRLSEAMMRVRELRREILELERLHPAAQTPPPSAWSRSSEMVASEEADHLLPQTERPPAPPPRDAPDDALDQLLRKARSLAARVRTLPAESDMADEAAGEIRRATELLRVRKLEEADLILTRLMRTLSAELPRT